MHAVDLPNLLALMFLPILVFLQKSTSNFVVLQSEMQISDLVHFSLLRTDLRSSYMSGKN